MKKEIERQKLESKTRHLILVKRCKRSLVLDEIFTRLRAIKRLEYCTLFELFIACQKAEKINKRLLNKYLK